MNHLWTDNETKSVKTNIARSIKNNIRTKSRFKRNIKIM